MLPVMTVRLDAGREGSMTWLFDLTTGQVVVILLRLVAPLLIPRRPLLGGVAAMLLDGVDVIVVDLFGPGGMGPHYGCAQELSA